VNRSHRSAGRDWILGGLFVALALVLPIAFHALGVGSVFLPMHIPVFLAGFFVSPLVATVVGFVSPLLSSVLTGMPPLSPPVAQSMVFELAVYGLVTALVYRASRRLYLSWAAAAVAGRLTAGLVGAFFLPLFGFKAVPLFYPLTAGLVTGLPGLVLQALFVPPVVYLLQRATGRVGAARGAGGGGSVPKPDADPRGGVSG